MTGYANRVITLDFPDLSEDPDNEPVRVVIRNPRLEPPESLIIDDDMEMTPDGRPADMQKAMQTTYKVIARLVMWWRAYDATAPLEINEETGEVTSGQERLPSPATPELVAKLPTAIINRIGEEIREAKAPQ